MLHCYADMIHFPAIVILEELRKHNYNSVS